MADRVLVLGGGALTGEAWQIGMLLGLARQGVDLTRADVLIGTSAGSLLAVNLAAGVELEHLYAQCLQQPRTDIAMSNSRFVAIRLLLGLALLSRNPGTAASRAGRLAQLARTVDEGQALRTARSLLPVTDWPGRPLHITATDMDTGVLETFRAEDGVPLHQAVAASCAAPGFWPPITIGEQRLIDGGLYSTTNASLARHHERAAVLAPFPKLYGRPSATTEARKLEEHGLKVVTLLPGKEERPILHRNPFDSARRTQAARAGLAQAPAAAANTAAVWQP